MITLIFCNIKKNVISLQGKGKATKKLRGPNSQDGKEELLKKAPHTFVFHRGQVGKSIHELEMDLRRVMEPFTASRLKVLPSRG